MGSNSTIHLYAEHLVNIRTLTLTATLSSQSTPLTTAKLSADATSLTLSHEDSSATLVLPTAIEGGGDALLELPNKATKHLELRLSLEEKEKGNEFIKQSSVIKPVAFDNNWVPWAATELERCRGTFNCKDCGTCLVNFGSDDKSADNTQQSITQWKDLPNENWAEMMDFWHCHKPTSEEPHEPSSGNDKGYAAGNKFKATRNVGFVDLGHFIFAQEDCINSRIELSRSDPQIVQCSQCDSEVGAIDGRSSGWRLWKWALSFNLPNKKRTFAVSNWISAMFLYTIENQGVRKLAVFDAHSDENKGLLLWIFTPDLTFSSSQQTAGEERQDPTRAMKVFWKDIVTESGKDTETSSIEELRWPCRLYKELDGALRRSKLLLPEKGRVFRDWNVALLSRFKGSESD